MSLFDKTKIFGISMVQALPNKEQSMSQVPSHQAENQLAAPLELSGHDKLDPKALLPNRPENLYRAQTGLSNRTFFTNSSNASIKGFLTKNYKKVTASEVFIKKSAKEFLSKLFKQSERNQATPQKTDPANDCVNRLMHAFTSLEVEAVHKDLGAGFLDKSLAKVGIMAKTMPQVRLGYASSKLQNNLAMIDTSKQAGKRKRGDELRKISSLLNS